MSIPQDSLLTRLGRADVVCSDCGLRYGKYSVGCSSVWNGTCDVCGKHGSVTEVRDYGYLSKGINELKGRIKEQSLEVANYMKCQEEIASQETDNHSITPSQEQIDKWVAMLEYCEDIDVFSDIAQWGADQQLELDAKWLDHNALNEAHLKIAPMGKVLKEAMRPKPPSLKKQAKFAAAVLRSPDETCSIAELQQHWHTICNALEQLDD